MVLLNLISTLRACIRKVSSGDNKTALKVLDVFSEIEESLKIPDENSSNKITSPIKNIMPDRHIAKKKTKKNKLYTVFQDNRTSVFLTVIENWDTISENI